MMTVHTAKGLEFPVVILVGLSENIFPSKQTRTLEQMEEERRLAFVALTRAQKNYIFLNLKDFWQMADFAIHRVFYVISMNQY